jgi:hypothetical protein
LILHYAGQATGGDLSICAMAHGNQEGKDKQDSQFRHGPIIFGP